MPLVSQRLAVHLAQDGKMGSYDGVHPAEKQLPPALRTAQLFHLL